MRILAAVLLLTACTVRHDGFTTLATAARDGDTRAIATLCARGMDPNAPSGKHGWTPLLHAVHKNQRKSVRALLDAGADVDRGAPNGTTPLMMAAGYGNRPMVEILLQRGARAEIRDRSGAVALDYALTGLSDVDGFTLFRCQNDTARVLGRVSPEPQRSSTRWARMKGC